MKIVSTDTVVAAFVVSDYIVAVANVYVQGAVIQNNNSSDVNLNATEVPKQNGNRSSTYLDKIVRTIKKKCLQNADEIKYNKVMEKLHDFNSYWEGRQFPRDVSPKEFYEVCTETSKNFDKYLNEFVEKLMTCLKPQEHFLRQFIMDGYGSYNQLYCDTSANLSASAVINGGKCMRKFAEHPETSPVNVCYESSKVFGANSTLDVITKEEFCSDLNAIQPCYDEIFDKHCPDVPELKEVRKALAKPRMKFCLAKTTSSEALN